LFESTLGHVEGTHRLNTIVLDANGGEPTRTFVEPTLTFNFNKVSRSNLNPIRSWSRLIGWSATKPAGGTLLSSPYVFTNNQRVYAQWETISVSLPGGDSGTASLPATGDPCGIAWLIRLISPRR
jgi:hypothetical protein